MRIFYSFPDVVGKAGIGETAFAQVRGLVELGHDVTLVCTTLGQPIEGLGRLIETLTVAGRRVPHRALGGSDRAYRYHDQVAARLLQRAHADVVHGWPIGSLRTLQAAARLGVPGFRKSPNTHTAVAYEVVAAECAAIGFVLPEGHSHAPNPRRLASEEAEFTAAHRILVPSDNVARSFLERGFSEHRLARHQYGYDPTRFPTPSSEPRQGEVKAVFLGRAEPRKGLHHALDACIRSGAGEAGGQLLVFGHFVPGYAEHLGDRLRAPGVEVRGFAEDPGAVLRSADILVLPSVEEGSALVTYEAQACGAVPLVSTATGARIEDGISGWFHAPGDVETLADHLRRLTGDQAARHTMSRAAVVHAEQLTWRAAAERLADCYLGFQPT